MTCLREAARVTGTHRMHNRDMGNFVDSTATTCLGVSGTHRMHNRDMENIVDSTACLGYTVAHRIHNRDTRSIVYRTVRVGRLAHSPSGRLWKGSISHRGVIEKCIWASTSTQPILGATKWSCEVKTIDVVLTRLLIACLSVYKKHGCQHHISSIPKVVDKSPGLIFTLQSIVRETTITELAHNHRSSVLTTTEAPSVGLKEE